jgi:hypothetical protein
MTTGDSALFPTFVFFTYILPRYFGWKDVFAGRPKLAAWWGLMQQDVHTKRVRGAYASYNADIQLPILCMHAALCVCKSYASSTTLSRCSCIHMTAL